MAGLGWQVAPNRHRGIAEAHEKILDKQGSANYITARSDKLKCQEISEAVKGSMKFAPACELCVGFFRV